MNPAQISKLVASEIGRIDQHDLARIITELLIEPREELREWDYGESGEQFPCWIVLEHRQTNTAIAYCDKGFGPDDPWGLLPVDDPRPNIGMDSAWFVSLEDAARAASFWRGKNPEGYEVR